jgi:hypothetical protein
MILALLTVLMSFAGSSATEHNAFKPAPATGSSTYTVKSHKPPAPWKSSHKGGTGPPPADYPAFQLYAQDYTHVTALDGSWGGYGYNDDAGKYKSFPLNFGNDNHSEAFVFQAFPAQNSDDEPNPWGKEDDNAADDKLHSAPFLSMTVSYPYGEVGQNLMGMISAHLPLTRISKTRKRCRCRW